MLLLEDDVAIDNPHQFLNLTCFAAKVLAKVLIARTGGGAATSDRHQLHPIHAVRFMNLGEAYLTSLSGARAILSWFCEVGLRDNFDMEMISYKFARRMSLVRANAMFLGKHCGA
mmetsp:Transcript_24114/g.54872  ORF Transcript_24114/g.54872 Transcript_24114/m.54872 type:complete len:115 (-) Transcript_24114:571-915(-)